MLCRSDSEDLSSDDVTGAVSDNDSNLVQELGLKSAESLTRRVTSYPRAAKRTAWRKQLIQKYQMPDTRSLNIKDKKKNKKINKESKENISKVVNGSSGEKDLAIDVASFVYHSPVVDDIDQVSETHSCPFCSVLCKKKQDITQHIKECHNSECAVVDHSEEDEETFSSDSEEPLDNDSDEDFTPDMETAPKRKNKQVVKTQICPNKKTCSEESENELCIDVNSVMNTDPSVNDIDSLTTCRPEVTKRDSKDDPPKVCCGCQACGMRFYQWCELRAHFDAKPDCRKFYQCDQCEQICVTTSFLKKHKKLHADERPHKCEVCDATFKDKAYLKRHGVKHSGAKDFKCDVCDKLFSHQRTLKEHRRRHTGEKPYKCKYCDAMFFNSSSLTTHITKHTGILPYKCQACGKLFAKSYGLKMHSLSHSNEKPFVCEVCGKGFKRPDHFKQHKVIHSENKPFKCDTCQKTFNQRVCLRKHLPCREHEKQQKKLQNSQAKGNKTKKKNKRARKPSRKKDEKPGDSRVTSQDSTSHTVNDTANDSCDVSNDFILSPMDANETSLLDSCYSPPSFVRPAAKLLDNEYYPSQHETHPDFQQQDRSFSTQHFTDRAQTSLLPASFVPTMFSLEEPLTLDTLPPLPTQHTHALPERPPSHENATDLGPVLLSSAMEPENLSSIVGETNSLFAQD